MANNDQAQRELGYEFTATLNLSKKKSKLKLLSDHKNLKN